MLFNDVLNTFFTYYYITSDLWFFYMHHPTDRITHTMTFDTPAVEHWLDPLVIQYIY